MRGEHGGLKFYGQIGMGSSPHARGTHQLPVPLPQALGIIPACAGNTFTQTQTGRQVWQQGSSPHARGTPRTLRRSSGACGIIPACAGNTWDGVIPPIKTAGSSPHARGTPQRRGRRQRRHGIIPACAGNTTFAISLLRSPRDHPRMRGEHPQGSRVRRRLGHVDHPRMRGEHE